MHSRKHWARYCSPRSWWDLGIGQFIFVRKRPVSPQPYGSAEEQVLPLCGSPMTQTCSTGTTLSPGCMALWLRAHGWKHVWKQLTTSAVHRLLQRMICPWSYYQSWEWMVTCRLLWVSCWQSKTGYTFIAAADPYELSGPWMAIQICNLWRKKQEGCLIFARFCEITSTLEATFWKSSHTWSQFHFKTVHLHPVWRLWDLSAVMWGGDQTWGSVWISNFFPLFLAIFFRFSLGQFCLRLASYSCRKQMPQNGAIQQAVARLLCNMVVDSQNRVPYSKQECAKMVQYNRVWLYEGATWL